MLKGRILAQTQQTEGDGAAIAPLYPHKRLAPDVDLREPHHCC